MNEKSHDLKELLVHYAICLSLVIFCLALLAVFSVFLFKIDRQRWETELYQHATSIATSLQNRLNDYESVSDSMAAFMTVNSNVTDSEFRQFVGSSKFSDRLPGLISIGYLSLVNSKGAYLFENDMHKQFPQFKIWAKSKSSPYFAPLVYSANFNQPHYSERFRGYDYASIEARNIALAESIRVKKPRATYQHAAMDDQIESKVVLLFNPVFGKASAGQPVWRISNTPTGFVFSTINVAFLIDQYKPELMDGNFILTVFEDSLGRGAALYKDDKNIDALITKSTQPPMYEGPLEFGGKHWLLIIDHNKYFSIVRWLGSNAGFIVLGIMLSFIFGYLAFRFLRHYKALEEDAIQSEDFTSFFESHPFAVYTLDRNRNFLAVNNEAVKQFGAPREKLIGSSVEAFLDPNYARSSRTSFERAFKGHAVSYDNVMRDTTGVESVLSVVLVPLRVDGKVKSVIGIAKNITERKRAAEELNRSRKTLQVVLDNIPYVIYWKGIEGNYQGANQEMLKISGIASIQDLQNKTDFDMPWHEHFEALQRNSDLVVKGKIPLVKNQHINIKFNGGMKWFEISTLPITNLEGGVESVLYLLDDITSRREAEAELFRRANFDGMTGLANRTYFYYKVEKAIVSLGNTQTLMALMYLDIDKFKNINDEYGHDVGDAVIKEFSARISGAVRTSDFIARMGGDEFVLLACNLPDSNAAKKVAEKVTEAMKFPFVIGELSLCVSVSIGIAFYSSEDSVDGWVKKSDQALYSAKRAGRNRYQFASIA